MMTTPKYPAVAMTEPGPLYPLSLARVEFVMACAVAGSKTGACVDILWRATEAGWNITATGEIVNASDDTDFIGWLLSLSLTAPHLFRPLVSRAIH